MNKDSKPDDSLYIKIGDTKVVFPYWNAIAPKNMLIIGGTGSLGRSLLKHFIDEYNVHVFSRDEAKHVSIKQAYPQVKSLIGDIRDRDAVLGALIKSNPDIIINAAALKNVPEVEEVPMEGIKTSIMGTENLIQALNMFRPDKKIKVLTISTDKAAKPVNSYGMAKALQERLHIRANNNNFVCNAVRYGNVLESRGSLIPLIKERFKNHQEIYLTHPEMTRFFLTLDNSVELIKTALEDNNGGKIFVPKIRSANIHDVMVLFQGKYWGAFNKIKRTSIRPGEKIHECLVSQEEVSRTQLVNNTYVIHDILSDVSFSDITKEFHSGDNDVLMSIYELEQFLQVSGVYDDNV